MGVSPESAQLAREHTDDAGKPLPAGMTRTDIASLIELQEQVEEAA